MHHLSNLRRTADPAFGQDDYTWWEKITQTKSFCYTNLKPLDSRLSTHKSYFRYFSISPLNGSDFDENVASHFPSGEIKNL